MSETIKVGDVVDWVYIPDGALWRHKAGTYELRCGDSIYVLDRESFRRLNGTDYKTDEDEPSVTIVALNLTGRETADDLRRLADVFEEQEADTYADRLLAAGWLPGMPPEDAARLPAAKESM